MARLFCVLTVLVVAGMFAMPAWAAVPYPPNCTVAWSSPQSGDDSTKIICPGADGDYINATIRDQFNQPMAGVLVQAVFSSPRIILEVPVQGNTNASGYVKLNIEGGCEFNVTGGDLNVISGTTVTCLGVTVYTNSKNIVSPDYNQDGVVNSQDFSYFADDWTVPPKVERDCHSNFLRTPATATENQTDSQDFAIFASHWLNT